MFRYTQITTTLAFALTAGLSAQEWYQEKPTSSPPARRFHSLQFDTARQHTLLFGGIDEQRGVVLGDTWRFDGQRWDRSPWTGPTARYQHAACFDSRRQRLLVFGGVDASGRRLGDTWSFDGSRWQLLSTAVGPTPRSAAGMSYDSRRDRVVLFGGRDATGRALGDTWEFDGSSWANPVPTDTPSPRFGQTLAYHAAGGVTLMFGGRTAPSGRFGSETWLWDGMSWRPVASPATTAALIYPAAAYNPDHGVVVLTGSVGSAATAISTWAFDGQTWHPGPAAPAALTGRQGHGLAYDSRRHAAVLFGGASIARAGALPRKDTWELSVPAAFLPFGKACDTRLGPLQLSTRGKPAIGTESVLQLGPVPSLGVPLLILGSSNTKLGGRDLPMDLPRGRRPGCQLLVSIEAVKMLRHDGRFRLRLPLNPSLLGKAFYAQGQVLGMDPAMSNAVKIMMGN